MADEPPRVAAGMLNTAMVVSLLLLESPAELEKIARAGWIKKDGPDRWRLVDVVQGFARYAKFTATTATTAQLAAAWGVTQQRIGQYAAQGIIKQIAGRRGLWNWAEATAGYVQWLRDEDRRSTKNAADSRVRDARAADIEMRMAERARVLIRFDDAEGTLDKILGMVRVEFGGLPARCTRDLEVRRDIEREVDGCLSRIVAQLGAEIVALRTEITQRGRPLNS